MNLDSIQDLFRSRNITETLSSDERVRVKNRNQPWTNYDSSLEEYDDTFLGVTPEGGIGSLVDKLVKEKGGKLNVLEIAGQGTELLEIKSKRLDKITVVSLNDFRSIKRKIVEGLSNLKYIAGDITKGGTWGKISNEKYDLVMCRPMAATEIVTSPLLGLALFNKMYESLSENGTMLLQINTDTIHEIGTNWLQALSQTEGIELNYRGNADRRAIKSDVYQPVLLLRKTKNAPKNLKFLKGVEPNSENNIAEIKQFRI